MATFTGNVDLLIAAPMLQDYLVDKDGTPMSGGTITMYHDNSRTTLKNWYYQSGAPGNYTYITLPNPLTLSAAGTISDLNGVDTIPFYYPYSEVDESVVDPYYVTIVNYAQTNQITRANFPFLGSGGTATTVNTFNNLVTNSSFWRNIQPNTTNITPFVSYNLSSKTQQVVAPSQHDGFRYPDVQFLKTNTSATDAVTFTPFPLTSSQPIANTVVPEYYLSHDCSAAGTGETQKCYQFPISLHVNTLASVPFTFSIDAQNDPTHGQTGTGQNVISLFIFQDTGTGGTAVPLIEFGQITLSTTWTNYTFTDVFPATTGLILGQGADDALYIQVQMPLNLTCGINFTNPSLYLTTNVVPNYQFQTYDQVDTIINSPRTGDIRTSTNTFQPYGWVAMNDGTIGSASATSTNTARNNADTWPLYNLLWNSILDHWAPVSGGRGANAYADFIANKTLTLPRALGRVFAGENGTTSASQTFTTNYGSSNFNLTVTSAAQYPTGTPVQLTNTGGSLPSSLSANTIYYVIYNNITTIQLATTIENAYSATGINIGSDSTGTSKVQTALGAYIGESLHTLVKAELPDPITTTADMINATVTGGATPLIKGDTSYSTGAVSNQGGGQGHNTIQPSTFMNVFIKL